MKCIVHIPSPLRSFTAGASKVTASGSLVSEVVADLEERFPGIRSRMVDDKDRRVRSNVRMYLGSREAAGLDDELKPGDQLSIICALAGG